MGQIQLSEKFTILDDIDHIIDEKIIDTDPQVILDLLDIIHRKFNEDEYKMTSIFNSKLINWINLAKLLDKQYLRTNKSALILLKQLLKSEESIQILNDSINKKNKDYILFDHIMKGVNKLALYEQTEIIDLVTQIFEIFTTNLIWREYLVFNGIICSLMLIIQDPNKKNHGNIQVIDIMIKSLQLIFEYANYKNFQMKKEIIKHRGSIALLYLLKKDYDIDITFLSLRILCLLCEDDFSREIILQDDGLIIAYKIYEDTVINAIKHTPEYIIDLLIRFIGLLGIDAISQPKIEKIGLVQDMFLLQKQKFTLPNHQYYLLFLLSFSVLPHNYPVFIFKGLNDQLQQLNFEIEEDPHELKNKLFFVRKFCSMTKQLNNIDLFLSMVNSLISVIQMNSDKKYTNIGSSDNINIDLVNYNSALECLCDITILSSGQQFLAQQIYVDLFIKELNEQIENVSILIPQKIGIAQKKHFSISVMLQIREDQIENIENIHLEIISIQLLSRFLTNLYVLEENSEELTKNTEYLVTITKVKQMTEKLSMIKELRIIGEEIEIFLSILPSQNKKIIQENFKIAQRLLNSSQIHLSLKASSILSHLAMNYTQRDFLVRNNIMQLLISNLNHEIMPIKREIASALFNLLKSPHGIILWLKFDSYRLQIDSSQNNDLLIKGNPETLPPEMGKYNNWGAFFDNADTLIVLKQGIVLPEKYTFVFWTLYPPPPQTNNTLPNYRILFQGPDGKGGHFAMDPTISSFGVFYEKQNVIEFQEFSFDLLKQKQGWYQIAVSFDSIKKISKLYVNGGFIEEISVLAKQNIKYIGNSKASNQSFGCVIDLRIYSQQLNDKAIEQLYLVDDNSYYNLFPDITCDIVLQQNGIEYLIKGLHNNYVEAQVQIFKVLVVLTSKQNCKLNLIKEGIFAICFNYINTEHNLLRYLVQKTLTQLG